VFFGRGIIISPCQKRWRTLWGRESSCSQIGRPKHALKVPLLFTLLSFGGWGKKDFFFIFSPGSHYGPFKFPMGSHQIPNVFPEFSICSPTCSPWHLTFIQYIPLANVVLLFT
jgi:hypothetical protein